MLILTIRTDKPEAELGLYENQTSLAYLKWQAHRQLAETIHRQIDDLLTKQGLALKDIDGLVVFRGPGSFTGLRIGVSVANALASGLNKPVVGAQGEQWLQRGIANLLASQNHKIVLPEYGAPPNVTPAKK